MIPVNSPRLCLCGHPIAQHSDGGRCLVTYRGAPICGCLIVEPLPDGWKPARVEMLPRPRAQQQNFDLPKPRTDIEPPDWWHQ